MRKRKYISKKERWVSNGYGGKVKRPTINILADIDHGKTVLLVFCMRL